MSVAARVRMTGPLTRYAEGFAAELTAHGYTDLSLANQLRLVADLSRWLERSQLAVAELDHEVVARFLARRRRTHTQFFTERALGPVLRHLEALGVIALVAPARKPSSALLREFEQYLIDERDVQPRRRDLCLTVAAEFLEGRRVGVLSAKDVTRFVDKCAARPGLAGRLSALRSLLRFLVLASKTPLELMHAVPAMPPWRLASLPKFLEPAELEAVFATCDRRTAVGCRDYAVLLLLGRLGLRAGEVAALQLEDLHWATGEISIHGKGRSLSRLPIPVDVGEALAVYLRRSLRSKATRAMFVRAHAPYDAVQSGAIIAIAKRALRSAGIATGGAHRLRHTAATQMLRRGGSLTEIAQVLRHRHVNTTAIYAKVDRASLHTIARVWPADIIDAEHVRDLALVWPGGAL